MGISMVPISWGHYKDEMTWCMLSAQQHVFNKRKCLRWKSVVRNLPANAGDAGSSPGSGRSPGVGNGNPFQYPCLGNSLDRGAWVGYSPRGLKESDVMEHKHKRWKQQKYTYWTQYLGEDLCLLLPFGNIHKMDLSFLLCKMEIIIKLTL